MKISKILYKIALAAERLEEYTDNETIQIL